LTGREGVLRSSGAGGVAQQDAKGLPEREAPFAPPPLTLAVWVFLTIFR